MTDFLIDVIVDPSKATPGMDKVQTRLQRLEKSGKRLGDTLRRAFTLVAVLAAARQIGVFADSLTNVQNRLRLVTRNTAELNAVTERLFNIAAKTRTGFSATATIFARTALAVKDLGLSLQETLDFTEALNQAIVLSGVKAQEANAGLIQLSQGLASGTLRGDELRSVLEQLPKVADLIAGELGVLRGELRLLGEQGLITTADIIRAFTGIAAADLTAAFGDSIPTISQGFSVLVTRIIQFIGKANDSSKISEQLARGLIFVAENLDTIGKVAIVAGAALAGPFAKAGVLFAARAVTALTAAIALNPFGALAILIVATVVAIDQFGDSISVTDDGLVSIRDVAVATWNAIREGLAPLFFLIKLGFKDALNFVIDAFATLNITFTDVLKFVRTFVGKMLSFFFGLNRAIASIFKDLKAIFQDVFGADTEKLVGQSVGFIEESFETIQNIIGFSLHGLGLIATELGLIVDSIDPEDKSFTGTFLTVGKNAHDAFVKGFGTDIIGIITESVAPVLKKIEKDARAIGESRRAPKADEEDVDLTKKGEVNTQLPFAVRNQIRVLGEEAEALGLSNRERGIQNKLLDLEAKLRAASVTVTPVQSEILRTLIEYNVALQEQADLLDDLKGPQEELTRRQETLGDLFDANRISAEQFANELKQLNLAQIALNVESGEGSFSDGFIAGMGDMLESVRSFSSEAGLLMADFFTASTQGFSQGIADAIVYGDSLEESIGNAARSALSSLLAGLIDVGVQFLLNSVLAKTLATTQIAGTQAVSAATAIAQTTSTAGAIASNTATTTAVVAGQASIATAAAPAAALTSVSSFGGAAIAGIIGLIAILALAKSFKDGGLVTGPGGSRTDSIPANLSNGEFVVNAESTSKFRAQLEAINNGEDVAQGPALPMPVPFRDGGIVHVAEARLVPQIGALNPAVIDSNDSGPAQSEKESGSAEGETGSGGVNIVNVIDPSIVEDFLDSSNGEQVILNLIERNASSIGAIVGSG